MKMTKKLMMAAACFAAASLFADTETVGGLKWTYTVSAGGASVGTYPSSYAIPESTPGAITIPSTLGGYPVTSIGNHAFWNHTGLTSVTMPNSVTNIESYAFHNCYSLTSMTIPDGVINIGECAFESCSGLRSVTIPNSVTNIGTAAFSRCENLTSVTIPGSVTSIGYQAFIYCYGLTSVTIGDGVTSIGRGAFSSCSRLKSVTIPATVSWIGDGAFEYTSYIGAIQAKMSKIIAESPEAKAQGYSLVDGSRIAEDRTIASVTVDGDCAIDDFVLKDGMVYDSVLRIVNTAPNEVKVTLPSGYVYETIGTASPLVLPASSKSLLTITRTADRTFLVTRQTLNVIQ